MKRIFPAVILLISLFACNRMPLPNQDIDATLESGVATQIAFLNLASTVSAQGTQIAILSQTSTPYPTPTLYQTPVPVDLSNEIAKELGLLATDLFIYTYYNDGRTAVGKYDSLLKDGIGWWFAINDNSSQWILVYISRGEKALCSQVEWLHSRTIYPVYPSYSTGCIP